MKLQLTCLFAATALLSSCTKDESTAVSTVTESGPSAALLEILEASPTGEPQPIHVLRASATPGDQVTLSGRIMGNAKPFADGRAAFIVGDPEVLTPCNENPDDACEEPWDNCCDSPEDRKRGTATIQVLGDDGRVLKEPLERVGGLQNLSNVTVSGTVAEGSSEDLLIVNATAIRAGE